MGMEEKLRGKKERQIKNTMPMEGKEEKVGDDKAHQWIMHVVAYALFVFLTIYTDSFECWFSWNLSSTV